jgi:hypothetical protein
MHLMTIVDRVPMEADLNLYGYSKNTLLIISQQNPFMTTVLFEKWTDEVFFPAIEGKRATRDYQGP